MCFEDVRFLIVEWFTEDKETIQGLLGLEIVWFGQRGSAWTGEALFQILVNGQQSFTVPPNFHTHTPICLTEPVDHTTADRPCAGRLGRGIIYRSDTARAWIDYSVLEPE